MANRRLGTALTLLHVSLGVLVYVLAGLVIFLMLEPVFGRVLAISAASATMLVFPLGLTSLALRTFRQLEQRTTFRRALPYVSEVFAALMLSVLFFAARGPVSSTLARVPERFPHAGGFAHGLASLVARWTAPPAISAVQSPVVSRDAGTPPAPDAAQSHPDVTPRAAPSVNDASSATPGPLDLDAGLAALDVASAPDTLDSVIAIDATDSSDIVDVTDVHEVPDARVAIVPATTNTDAGVARSATAESRVPVCDRILGLFPADLGHGSIDEIVVECRDGVHVLWLQAGGLFERTRFAPHAPAGATAIVREPRIADVNNDGRDDLVLCAHWLTEGGNVTGGGVWSASGTDNGQFAQPQSLYAGACAGVDFGDIDGDGASELVVALEGNPAQTARPNGELLWFERTGIHWNQRGRTALRRDPLRLWLADVDNDSILDVAVLHGGPGDGITVNPGSRHGLLAIDIRLPIPSLPDRSTHVVARLDDDPLPDSISSDGGTLVLSFSSPTANRPQELSRALDYVEASP